MSNKKPEAPPEEERAQDLKQKQVLSLDETVRRANVLIAMGEENERKEARRAALMKSMRPAAWRDCPDDGWPVENEAPGASKTAKQQARFRQSSAVLPPLITYRGEGASRRPVWCANYKEWGVAPPSPEHGIHTWDIVDPEAFVKHLVNRWISASPKIQDPLIGLRAFPSIHEQAMHPLLAQAVAEHVLSDGVVEITLSESLQEQRMYSSLLRYLTESMSYHIAENETPVPPPAPISEAAYGSPPGEYEDVVARLMESRFDTADKRKESPLGRHYDPSKDGSVFFERGLLEISWSENIAKIAGYDLKSEPEDVKAWANFMHATWSVYGIPNRYSVNMLVNGTGVGSHADAAIVDALWKVSRPDGVWQKDRYNRFQAWAIRVHQTNTWDWIKQKAAEGEFQISAGLRKYLENEVQKYTRNGTRPAIPRLMLKLLKTVDIANDRAALENEKQKTLSSLREKDREDDVAPTTGRGTREETDESGVEVSEDKADNKIKANPPVKPRCF